MASRIFSGEYNLVLLATTAYRACPPLAPATTMFLLPLPQRQRSRPNILPRNGLPPLLPTSVVSLARPGFPTCPGPRAAGVPEGRLPPGMLSTHACTRYSTARLDGSISMGVLAISGRLKASPRGGNLRSVFATKLLGVVLLHSPTSLTKPSTAHDAHE